MKNWVVSKELTNFVKYEHKPQFPGPSSFV